MARMFSLSRHIYFTISVFIEFVKLSIFYFCLAVFRLPLFTLCFFFHFSHILLIMLDVDLSYLMLLSFVFNINAEIQNSGLVKWIYYYLRSTKIE